MAEIFCCTQIRPFRPRTLDHELKFTDFRKWEGQISGMTKDITAVNPSALLSESSAYTVQVVRQVNYGPVKWKRYFAADKTDEGGDAYKEVVEMDLIEANYEKLNTYKNFKCAIHDLFFELNIYKKNPINKHHWRANIARPAGAIDLHPSSPGPSTTSNTLLTPFSEEKKNEITNKNEEDEKEHRIGEKEGVDEKDDEANEKIVGQKKDFVGSDPQVPTEGSPAPKKEIISFRGDFERTIEHLSEDDFDDDPYDNDDYDDGEDGGQDFAACSLEDCGYCGKCMY
ncbi:hypothetical protein HYFRA_00005678 [Hymenoscyphus fraxineus]|uniref:Uncharacterized protein n=1 Tax=Hymenoscyphus fraxineus TaxID=746836 RepID=A0A9N9PGL1_9HELO|nr:hypothetical protein HYFRA_00005678 [Hymenoscyphus fraxineus]